MKKKTQREDKPTHDHKLTENLFYGSRTSYSQDKEHRVKIAYFVHINTLLQLLKAKKKMFSCQHDPTTTK